MIIKANLIDIIKRRIYPAEVKVENGKIHSIAEIEFVSDDAGYILPGFVDAHIHIESSMMPPTEFARLAVVHGTVATVSDPHEIANVLGEEGVQYMLDEAKRVPLKFCFGAPSCVPATSFETAGAQLNAEAVKRLLDKNDIGYLSEMMNFPGVLMHDPDVTAKINYAQKIGKPVDGHAPGLRGVDAQKYFATGISTDHECFTYEEGKEKAELGVKILIREGSAARNYDALHPLIKEFPKQIMFCSDDKHPDDLIEGHINLLVQKSLSLGYNLFDVLYAACIHPVNHYGLNVGLLQEGDPADFIHVSDIESFTVLQTIINGQLVAKEGVSLLKHEPSATPNLFKVKPKSTADFKINATSSNVRIIKAIDGEIVTESIQGELEINSGKYIPSIEKDILKIAVVNRYEKNEPPSVAFVQGFGLSQGALASSVAHDSHNIVVVGTSDEAICTAVNEIIKSQGGVVAVNNKGESLGLGLPIAGLMSPIDGYQLAEQYKQVDTWTKEELGCKVAAPFMLLSFLALPVIPSLKITDLGLFDVDKFKFTTVAI
jgi:adenine deaminase